MTNEISSGVTPPLKNLAFLKLIIKIWQKKRADITKKIYPFIHCVMSIIHTFAYRCSINFSRCLSVKRIRFFPFSGSIGTKTSSSSSECVARFRGIERCWDRLGGHFVNGVRGFGTGTSYLKKKLLFKLWNHSRNYLEKQAYFKNSSYFLK